MQHEIANPVLSPICCLTLFWERECWNLVEMAASAKNSFNPPLPTCCSNIAAKTLTFFILPRFRFFFESETFAWFVIVSECYSIPFAFDARKESRWSLRWPNRKYVRPPPATNTATATTRAFLLGDADGRCRTRESCGATIVKAIPICIQPTKPLQRRDLRSWPSDSQQRCSRTKIHYFHSNLDNIDIPCHATHA